VARTTDRDTGDRPHATDRPCEQRSALDRHQHLPRQPGSSPCGPGSPRHHGRACALFDQSRLMTRPGSASATLSMARRTSSTSASEHPGVERQREQPLVRCFGDRPSTRRQPLPVVGMRVHR
jgi:hypothetical protein